MDCLFCKIINGEIPSYKIYEDDLVLAFLDVNPKENGHTLIIPKKHFTDYLELNEEVFNHIFKVAKELTPKICEKLNADGTNFVWNYGNVQVIKHFHLHIIPRYNENRNKLTVEEVYEKLK